MALINVIASILYSCELPGFGVALAALAANNLSEAATCWWKGRVIEMAASTIHKALNMEPENNEEYDPNGKIICGVFICEESSMDGSSLLNAILANTEAQHVVFIGDAHQLQPIGTGKPFQDVIASGVIPVTWLTRNYRTNSAGIRALCEDIKARNFSPENVSKYEASGGVEFLRCDRSKKAVTAAKIYADLV